VLITCSITRSFGGSSPIASTPVTHSPYLKLSRIGSALLTSEVISTLAVSRADSQTEARAQAVGVGSSARFGADAWEPKRCAVTLGEPKG
jgi:hypothetical protein